MAVVTITKEAAEAKEKVVMITKEAAEAEAEAKAAAKHAAAKHAAAQDAVANAEKKEAILEQAKLEVLTITKEAAKAEAEAKAMVEAEEAAKAKAEAKAMVEAEEAAKAKSAVQVKTAAQAKSAVQVKAQAQGKSAVQVKAQAQMKAKASSGRWLRSSNMGSSDKENEVGVERQDDRIYMGEGLWIYEKDIIGLQRNRYLTDNTIDVFASRLMPPNNEYGCNFRGAAWFAGRLKRSRRKSSSTNAEEIDLTGEDDDDRVTKEVQNNAFYNYNRTFVPCNVSTDLEVEQEGNHWTLISVNTIQQNFEYYDSGKRFSDDDNLSEKQNRLRRIQAATYNMNFLRKELMESQIPVTVTIDGSENELKSISKVKDWMYKNGGVKMTTDAIYDLCEAGLGGKGGKGGKRRKVEVDINGKLCDIKWTQGHERPDIKSWPFEYIEDMPQQPNGCDCGIYILKVMEALRNGDVLDFHGRDMHKERREMETKIAEAKVVQEVAMEVAKEAAEKEAAAKKAQAEAVREVVAVAAARRVVEEEVMSIKSFSYDSNGAVSPLILLTSLNRDVVDMYNALCKNNTDARDIAFYEKDHHMGEQCIGAAVGLIPDYDSGASTPFRATLIGIKAEDEHEECTLGNTEELLCVAFAAEVQRSMIDSERSLPPSNTWQIEVVKNEVVEKNEMTNAIREKTKKVLERRDLFEKPHSYEEGLVTRYLHYCDRISFDCGKDGKDVKNVKK